MCKSKTIVTSLDICKQYVDRYLESLYELDIEKLDASQRLKVLVFYEQLIELLYNNTALVGMDRQLIDKMSILDKTNKRILPYEYHIASRKMKVSNKKPVQ
ncbi:hypothetical protein ABIE26_001167 [Pedobacter africanus]|uniref:Uncharacterized protein n=1 Tax=Pedobacter africanus TaxID=151894 RepID=A0ACC6KT21_9SPHI|nr:hypothetical protein [Pedobacter africanus]MDR6782345.1 hypothetical protein [Pedobacter africanus]